MKRNISFWILLVWLLAGFSSCEKYKDDLEPNDSRSEATVVQLGTEYPAMLSKGDEDWYKFTTAYDGYWDVTGIDITVKDDIVIVLKIYDEQGNLGVEFTGDRGVDIPFNLFSTGGTFYIKIYSFTANEKGNYSLEVYAKPSNDSNEPDDSFDDARIIDTYPTGWLSGKVLWNANEDFTIGDWEYFYVKVNAGKELELTLDPEETDCAMNFYVYDEVRNLQGSVAGDPGEILSYQVTNTGGTAEYFYLKVGATLGAEFNGTYYISYEESDALK